MFERFTTQTRATVALAVEEARAAGHAAVGTEHLLLGLLHAPETVAARALATLDVELAATRLLVIHALGFADATDGQIPFTPAAQRALQLAPLEAVARGRGDVEPEGVLLSLLADPGAGAVHILRELHVSPEDVRRELEDLAGDAADARRLSLWPGIEQTVAEGELAVGWRGRGIALAALGAAVLARSAFAARRSGPLEELEMQLLVYLALALGGDPASSVGEGEAVDSLPVALACERTDLSMAIEVLQREQLIVRLDDFDDDRVAITPEGVDRVERWLARAASLFGGWPPDRPSVDDATG